MKPKPHIDEVLTILDRMYPTIPMHEVHKVTPFRLLVAIVLSQRARDSVTVPTTVELFKYITTAHDLDIFPLEKLEKIIKPIGFYHAKAQALKKLAHVLVEKYKGEVPRTEDELLSLPQVGRKTANILLTEYFDTPQIAVDVHVHRITNRLGWVQTTKPEETEKKLTQLIPKKWHSMTNRVFVMHGQHVCFPRNPNCTACPILKYCKRVGLPSLEVQFSPTMD